MKIGFIQDDEAEPASSEIGFAGTSISENESDGSWLEWGWRVLVDFCIVNGLIDIVQDLLNYFR